jgi:hypothetical protein
MNLTSKDKDILKLALEQLDKYYDDRESVCRAFKWICNVPQGGEGYEKNKNVFDIQDKTIAEIQKAKAEARQLILNLIAQEPN